jgi:MFS family permease
VLGTLGDRAGRKPAMLISFLLMGVGMLGLALTPSYARIGIAAPILAVLFRLIQGFALGGEVGPTTAYMVEAAPANRRGLYGSMQYLTQDAANLLAALVGVALSSALSPQHLQDWGWRIAFLLGVIIVPFGMFLRDRLPETLHAADDAALAPDATRGALGLSARIGPYLPIIAFGLVMLSSGTIGSYVLEYLTTYALNTLHLPAGISFGLVVVTSICAIIFDPISGALSDRYGRRRIIIIGYTLTLVSVFPAFWIVNRYPSPWIVYSHDGPDRRAVRAGHAAGDRRFDGGIAEKNPRRRGRYYLCVRDLGVRRLDAVRHQLAHSAHRQSAGPGVVLDRRTAAGADGRITDAGDRARESRLRRTAAVFRIAAAFPRRLLKRNSAREIGVNDRGRAVSAGGGRPLPGRDFPQSNHCDSLTCCCAWRSCS